MITQTTALWNLKSGDITLTWCKAHMQRTDHIYLPGSKVPLVCLDCHPELRPQESETNNVETN